MFFFIITNTFRSDYFVRMPYQFLSHHSCHTAYPLFRCVLHFSSYLLVTASLPLHFFRNSFYSLSIHLRCKSSSNPISVSYAQWMKWIKLFPENNQFMYIITVDTGWLLSNTVLCVLQIIIKKAPARQICRKTEMFALILWILE